MTRKLSIALLVAFQTIAAGMPEAQAEAKRVHSLAGISEYQLDNGLKVLLYPDSSKPTVTINLTVFVGSRHEGYGETGMAHLLEHMLFKGTPTNKTIPRSLQERGANFNGTTWVDRTNYYETLPATDANLEFALALEADRLVNSYVNREDLLSEMTVVRNEFERGENSPERILDQRLLSVAFDWHNYGKSTIGNRTDIERVPIENLKAFYKKYYQPNNAMVVVAGKFEEARALDLVEKHFGPIPKSPVEIREPYTEEPPQDGERSVILRRVGDVGMVGAVYHAPSGSHSDNPPLEVLGMILDAEPSGRLYQGMVEKRLATSVAAGVTSWRDAGVFQTQAEVRKEDSLEQARDRMIEITESVDESDIEKNELDRAKQKILKRLELAASDTTRIAVDLSDWAAQGDWRLYLLHPERIKAVTADDIKRVAAKYLLGANRTVGMFVPSEQTQKVEVPVSPDLAKLFENFKEREVAAEGEKFDTAPRFIESRVERVAIAEGIKAVLLPKQTKQEAVFIRLNLRYGTRDTLKGFEAAAQILPSLMTHGTKSLSRQELQDALDSNWATMQAGGDTGVASFAIQTKRDYVVKVIDLLRQVLREPTLDSGEFETLRREAVAAEEQKLNDPQSRGITLVRRKVSPYPKDDVRYTPTIEEAVERLKTLELPKVTELHSFLGSHAGEIAIVGDFDPANVKKQLVETFGGWSSREPYARIPKKTFEGIEGSIESVQIPDKPNAVYTSGVAFAMKDSDPDYPALLIGNEILGAGALSSRLGDRVRQKEGLSYGIFSAFRAEPLDPRASVTIMAICNPVNIAKVQSAVREELDRLWKDGVGDDELRRAKSGYLQQEAVDRAKDPSLAQILSETAFTGRTMEYYAELEEKVNQLTGRDIVEALRRHIDVDDFVTVLAGSLEGAN